MYVSILWCSSLLLLLILTHLKTWLPGLIKRKPFHFQKWFSVHCCFSSSLFPHPAVGIDELLAQRVMKLHRSSLKRTHSKNSLCRDPNTSNTSAGANSWINLYSPATPPRYCSKRTDKGVKAALHNLCEKVYRLKAVVAHTQHTFHCSIARFICATVRHCYPHQILPSDWRGHYQDWVNPHFHMEIQLAVVNWASKES